MEPPGQIAKDKIITAAGLIGQCLSILAPPQRFMFYDSQAKQCHCTLSIATHATASVKDAVVMCSAFNIKDHKALQSAWGGVVKLEQQIIAATMRPGTQSRAKLLGMAGYEFEWRFFEHRGYAMELAEPNVLSVHTSDETGDVSYEPVVAFKHPLGAQLQVLAGRAMSFNRLCEHEDSRTQATRPRRQGSKQ